MELLQAVACFLMMQFINTYKWFSQYNIDRENDKYNDQRHL